ncbi:MAG: toll/interleukin-1 receptor domain-containing protein, partial [Candidatus Delongbacteria bacterium]|nr:toll/interleukin-1 receptor domain-containing protein [Candidatus Delongbacteria bacterium]
MQHQITTYEGKGKYAFVSYSHKDEKIVYPIIMQLQKEGYQLWLDLGIEIGSDWPDVIASKLNKCDAFLVFLSKNAGDSHNCRKERNYAFALNKNVLPVLLEEMDFSPVEEMQLSSVQALLAYKMEASEVANKIMKFNILDNCKANNVKLDQKEELKRYTITFFNC